MAAEKTIGEYSERPAAFAVCLTAKLHSQLNSQVTKQPVHLYWEQLCLYARKKPDI